MERESIVQPSPVCTSGVKPSGPVGVSSSPEGWVWVSMGCASDKVDGV